MFGNSVLRSSVNTTEWLRATAVRAGKTMAQTALSMLTVGQMNVNWVNLFSVSLVAGLVSVLTSVAGIPEVKTAYMTDKEESV